MEKPISKVECIGSSSFGMLKASIAPNHVLVVEPGAMASQDVGIECVIDVWC